MDISEVGFADALYSSLVRTEVIHEEATQLRRSFRDAKSPLSVVRQEAYREIASRIEQSLAVGPPRSTAALTSLESHVNDVIRTTRAALCAPPPSSPVADWAVPAGAVTDSEVCALLLVLQVACLFSPPVQKRALDDGILKLLLHRIPTASPALACACFDLIMAIQLRQPAAFVAFVDLDGIKEVSNVLKHSTDRVRAHAARFLNLQLTQLAPNMVVMARASSAAGEDDQAALVEAAAETAKRVVEEVLGREAAAMLMRYVDLGDVQAEGRLSQLASALQFFIG